MFEIHPVSARVGLRLRAISEAVNAGQEPLEDLPGDGLWRLACGKVDGDNGNPDAADVWDLILEHVSLDEMRLIGDTAYYWQVGARAYAAAYWRGRGNPLTTPDPAGGASTPTSTDEATTTPSRKRGSTTSSRRKSSRS